MRRSVARAVLAMLMVCASALGLAGTAAAGTDQGDTDKATYTWHVGDDFLTNAVGSPDGSQATAANGDIITVEGTGAFTLKKHAASGGGTFKHHVKATDQTLTGTFQVRKVKSFTSYGNGTPQGTPPNFFGGLLVLAVDITPDTDPKARIPAILTVDCLLGSPPAGAQEGIKLKVPGLIDFDTIVPGSATVFVQL